jgi:hypothetical protein
MFGVTHVDHADSIGEPVANVSEAAIDHHLDAIAPAALVGATDKFHIPTGNGIHYKVSHDISS